MAVKTVENHKIRIFDKLGVHTQAQAVSLAIGQGMLANASSGMGGPVPIGAFARPEGELSMLATYASVEHALSHYTDCFQPRTGSVTSLGGGKGSGVGHPFHPALLEGLEERTELRRRMAWLDREEAVVLVALVRGGRQARASSPTGLGRSLRHVYRRRNAGVSTPSSPSAAPTTSRTPMSPSSPDRARRRHRLISWALPPPASASASAAC